MNDLPKLPDGWTGPFKAFGNGIWGKFNGVESDLFYLDGGLPNDNAEQLVAILNYIYLHQAKSAANH